MCYARCSGKTRIGAVNHFFIATKNKNYRNLIFKFFFTSVLKFQERQTDDDLRRIAPVTRVLWARASPAGIPAAVAKKTRTARRAPGAHYYSNSLVRLLFSHCNNYLLSRNDDFAIAIETQEQRFTRIFADAFETLRVFVESLKQYNCNI